jgi:hypothetical protein
MTTKTLLLAVIGLILATQLSWAKDSVGTTFTGATDYTNVELGATFDLDRAKKWEGELSYDHTTSTQTTLSRANEFIFGASYLPEEENEYYFNFAFWNDTVNKIVFVGPGFEWSHQWMDGKGKDAEEILGLTAGADLHFYGAEVSGIPVETRKARSLTENATEKTTQFRPGIQLEKPFLDETVTPFVGANHYFYSNDPRNLESPAALRGRQLGAAASASVSAELDSFVSGFIKNSWSAGFTLVPAEKTSVRAEGGRAQSALDDSWSNAYGVKLTHTFAEHYKVKVGWNYTDQEDTPANFFSIGLTYNF